METKVEAIPSQADQKLQQEFNQWAAAGRGDEMEDHHSNIMDQTLSLMDLQPADRVLDLGAAPVGHRAGWPAWRARSLAWTWRTRCCAAPSKPPPVSRMSVTSGDQRKKSYSLRWMSELKVPVHALSEVEYKALLAKHGFSNVQARRIPDRSPSPETYSGKWFKNTEELRDFKRIGALLLIAAK